MNSSTLIFNLTVEQLQQVIQDAVAKTIDQRLEEKMPKATESGISGLARIIGKSRAYAQELKSKGVFDGSFTQHARTITWDVVKVQALWNNYQLQNI